jgi:uncharacterized membrane protein
MWALTAAFQFAEGLIVPLLATDAPMFAVGFEGISSGSPSEVSLGILPAVYSLTSVLYLVGGVLFGVATFRAGILPRWAGGGLAVGTVAPLVLSLLLPHEFIRLAAVPVGIAVALLGYALWSERRETQLLGDPEITANNARFVASPIPVTVHIVSVTVFSLLGALQFVPLLRRGRPNWHRIAGRILVPAGLLVALTGLWMSAFYPRPPGDGESLVVVRLIVGSAMVLSIVLAVLAIRRRDFASHGAWMTRAYAIALGAGTQVFTILPWVVIFGPIGVADELPRTVLMTAAWVINLAVAEYVIRRRPSHRSSRTSAGLVRRVGADALA